ncbi:hypothetical protein M3J09_010675 [Ascochyta lentis]
MATAKTLSATPALPTYEQVPETQYELNWADLATLDLSVFDTPDGKKKACEPTL